MDLLLRRPAALVRRLLALAVLLSAVTLSTNGGGVSVPETSAASFNKPTYSSPIAISADNNFVWSVNPKDNTVSVIRTSDNTLLTNIGVDVDPRSVAVDPNNAFAYVANAGAATISVIRIFNPDPNNFNAGVDSSVGQNGKFATGAEPWDIVASPDGNRIFVANSGQDTITVINANTRTIIGNVDLRNSLCNDPDRNRHFQPRGMAVTLDNTKLFVTRFLSFTKSGGVQGDDNGKEGVVCRLNINTNSTNISDYQPAAQIALASQITGFQIDATLPPDGVNDDTSAYPNQLQSVVIRGNRAFLPNIASSPSGPLRFNVDTHAFLNQINGVTGANQTDGGALNLHLGARDPEPGKTRLFFANPWAVAFTNQSGAGNAYVVSAGSDLLVKLNVDAADQVSFTVDANTTRYVDLHDPNNAATSGANAAKNPVGIVINESTNTAYVTNVVSRNVSVVNLTTDAVTTVIKTTNLPAPGSQAERNLVGAEMFFSSRGVFDRPAGTTVSTTDRLSSEGWQNCASCHFDGLTDGTVWIFGAGSRKSVPLNGSFNPNNTSDQRVLNYSAIFDEVQDFEANIRNVSGPGNLPAPAPPNTLDPNHGLLIGNNGDINGVPNPLNAFTTPNAGRPQHTVTLSGSTTAVPALDALKEWVQFAVRTPQGRLTATELTAGGGNATGGGNQADVDAGRSLFLQAGCNTCHGGGKWTISTKDFTSPPAAGEIFTERTPPQVIGNPIGTQYLDRFLKNIGSFNLGVPGQGNPIGNNVGAVEKASGGMDGLGIDYNADGKGIGFNVPSLLAIFQLPPYYHNGSCESLACVLSNQRHRTGNNTFPDVLSNPADQAKVVAFLETIDKGTVALGIEPPATATPTATATATATATVTATPSQCSPRPPVLINVVPNGPGRIQATVSVSNPGAGNGLQQIRFNAATNAVITAGAQTGNGNFTVGNLAGAQQFQFQVQRVVATQAATAPLVVTDACGDWPTFVGLGVNVP